MGLVLRAYEPVKLARKLILYAWHTQKCQQTKRCHGKTSLRNPELESAKSGPHAWGDFVDAGIFFLRDDDMIWAHPDG